MIKKQELNYIGFYLKGGTKVKDLWFGILLHGGSFIGYRLEPVTIEPLKTSGIAITGEFIDAQNCLSALLREIQKIGMGYHIHILSVPFTKENFI